MAADRTPFADTVANPDGSYTVTTNTQPQHARSGANWVVPDATLHVNSNGTVAPKASVSGLTLSGGGTGPLAVLNDGNGRTLSVSMPMRLPKPAVSGSTAIYAGVLPGVDLQVDATVGGGFSEVLVVRDAAAAANPALATLRMATTVKGLRLSTDADSGAVTAIDASTGKPVFAAPPPLMWDSTPQTTTSAPHLSTAEPDTGSLDSQPAVSDAYRPGGAAHIHTVPLRADGTTLILTPPAAGLLGSDVRYPLYIDPAIAPSANPRAYTQSWHTTTTAYNPSDNLRTGFSDWKTGCSPDPCTYFPGITHTFLHFDGVNAHPGTVTEAHLQLTQLRHSCNSSFKMNASPTNDFGSNLNWNNQPGALGPTTSVSVENDGGYQVDATGAVREAQSYGWQGLSYVLWMDTESDHCAFRHWDLNSSLVITYWSQPYQPKNLSQTNGNQTSGCAYGAPGTWIPAAAGNQIQLNYTISSQDAGFDLYGNAWLSVNGGGYNPITTQVAYSGGDYTIHDTISVADGSGYAWYAQVDNTHIWSGATATCYFSYDSSPPTQPTVTSPDYPSTGPTRIGVGGSGTLTLSAADTGPNPSGLSSFNYNINGTGLTSGGGGEHNVAAGSGTTTITVPLPVLHWGTNTLWAQSTDVAGNVSQPVHYDFYVQQSAFGPYTPGTAGDIDGDNNPDLVTVDRAGNLRLFTHPDTAGVNPTGDSSVDPLQFGGRVIMPHNTDTLWPEGTFAGALVSHAGSFSGKNADDLIIAQNGNLAVAQNVNGNGTAWTTTTDITKPACVTCTNYNSTDWSSLTQAVAVPTTPGARPDLLTMEFYNGVTSLWLYPPTSGVIGFNSPTLISTDINGWQWEQVQLLGASQVPGFAGTTLISRDYGAGNILFTPNITTPINGSPSLTSTVVGGGFYPYFYPLVGTNGRADSNGNWPIWAVGTDGTLNVFAAHTTASGTNWANGGTPSPLSNSAWGTHELTIGSGYTPPGNVGIAVDGVPSYGALFDMSYSAHALATGTLGAGVISSCPWATCAPGTAPGQTLTTSNNDTFTLRPGSAGTFNAWLGKGQTLPAPIDDGHDFADHISFLGSATASTAAGATGTAIVTFTDGHTQQIQVTFSDWTLNNSTWSPAGGNTTIATAPYRITTSGAQDPHQTYLFATADAQLLDNGRPLSQSQVQISSITLPTNSAMAFFAIAVN